MQRPLTAFHKDLHKISAPGVVKDREQDRDAHCARACALQIHMDISREQFYARVTGKMPLPENLGLRFLRACTVEMHMDIAEEPFYTRILK